MNLKTKILNKLKEVLDPELGINVVDMGLIYGIDIKDNKAIIEMTLTTPHCPLKNLIIQNIKDKVTSLEEIKEVEVKLVWDPPWTPENVRRSEKIKAKTNQKPK